MKRDFGMSCRTTLLVAVLITVPVRAGLADEVVDDPAYQQALQAFEQQHYADAEGAFALLARRYPERSEPRFWEAYSAHKRGDLVAASAAVEAALALEPDSVDALYLAALLSHRLGDRETAVARFERVGELQPDGDLGRSSRQHLTTLLWQEERDAAIALVASGDLDAATVELDRLSQQRPDDVTVLYYRGYTAYHRGDVDEAVRSLDAVLDLQPDHGWARYIRALALLRRGDRAAAEDELVALSAGGHADVAAEAANSLADVQHAAPRTPTPSGESATAEPGSRRLAGSWRLGGGLDVDSNPAYVPESSYVPTGETAVAVTARVSGEQPLLRRGGTTIFLGPRALVRAYPAGPTEYDLAQVTARIELNQRGRKLMGWVGGGGGVSLLGWKPFLDIEELYLGGAWQQARWTSSRLSLSGFRRGSHLEDYQNLGAWGGNTTLSQRFEPDPLFRAELGYALRGEKAQGYEVSWDGLTGEAGPVPYVATLSADATYIGHGPLASLRVTPPWQDLRLTASAALQWRTYQVAEQVEYDVDGAVSTWAGDRRDRRLTLSAEASVRTVWKLHVTLRYSAVLNRSSLDGEDSPVDRNYDRHLVSVGLEVRL